MCPNEQASSAAFFHQGASELCLDVPGLKQLATPVQHLVGGHAAANLGLGHVAAENLLLRKQLGKPGAPFGGLGLFDPQKAAAADAEPPLTAEVVKGAKLDEFRRCSRGEASMYFWALQPIFNVHDRVVAAEVLVRARNGSDSAPFEDIQAIMDPDAPSDVKQVYGEWKATEIVDFTLKALREHSVLQKLAFISANVRPLDLGPESLVFSGVLGKLAVLSDEDRQLLLSHVLIEVCEDQEHPESMPSHIREWQRLGFRFAADDTLSELAASALGKEEPNFNTMAGLGDLLWSFGLVKVDMAWAGHLLFLAHPCVATRPALRDEISQHARDEDEVYTAAGPALRKLGVKHSAVLAEFVRWAKGMIAEGKKICIELSVRRDDKNCAWALQRLAEMDLDIFGKDQQHFCFQGGPCGAKAFTPEQLAAAAQAFEE